MIIRGRHYLNGDVYDFDVRDGRIAAISSPSCRDGDLGGEDYWIAPGLIDIQINGYEGIDFCPEEATPEGVCRIAERVAGAGVTAFLPTITTGSWEAMISGLQAIARACEGNSLARERILGIHLEGPYISPEDGPRGAHPLAYVRNPDLQEFCALQDAAGGRIRLITIAPELPGALDLIAAAAQKGVVIAIGHHAATRSQIDAAVAAGAVMSTHLGNGSHSQLPRHPNYIWEQLANDALMASIIVDGHHLPASVVKSFYRVKGVSRLILVSDAISAAGLPPGRTRLMGLDVELGSDGAVRLCGTPYLAGSALRLCDAISNVVQFAGATFAEAITMASTNPAHLLGVADQRGHLRIGAPADISVFRAAPERYELVATVCGGSICYQA